MARPGIRKLLSDVRACTICAASLPNGPRPVVQLSRSARLLIAGQAPGRRVHASGVPFDDPSGERLRDWLGLTRDEFYDPRRVAILPMGFCYPGTGKSGDLPPRPECAPAWREALLAQLDRLETTVVLGKFALDYHLPDAAPSAGASPRRPEKVTFRGGLCCYPRFGSLIQVAGERLVEGTDVVVAKKS